MGARNNRALVLRRGKLLKTKEVGLLGGVRNIVRKGFKDAEEYFPRGGEANTLEREGRKKKKGRRKERRGGNRIRTLKASQRRRLWSGPQPVEKIPSDRAVSVDQEAS